MTRNGVHDATTDVRRVQDWWRRSPSANIALAIPDGHLVVDIDSPDALGLLKAEGLLLPSTATALTGRSRHLWFVTETDARNRVGLFPGIDTRAPGGYVVAPPSIHPTGAIYRWQVDLRMAHLAEAPAWLLDRLKKPPPCGRPPEAWERTVTGPVPEGRRNQTLAEVAGLLFRALPAAVAAEMALCWARAKMAPPLPEHEVQRTIDSIAGRELKRRRGRS